MTEQRERNGFPVPIPFLDFLGMQFRRSEGGAGEVELALKPHLMNSFDMAHGGVTMTLLDVAMAMAARSMTPDFRGVVTIEMKTTFLRPGRGTLRAIGRCVHRTGSMAFCEAEVLDAQDLTVARASGTFKYAGPSVSAGGGDG